MPPTPRCSLLSLFVGCLFLVGGLAPETCHAQSAAPEIPPLTGRVVDDADLLSDATERYLTRRLRTHADSTSNQIAVLTVESLNGAILEQYSLEVARAWELGQAAFNNGVLLLVAEEERKIRIEVGYGLEGDLPDVVASRIIRNDIQPRYRRGDFDGGTEAGVDAILARLEGTYVPRAEVEPTVSAWEKHGEPRLGGLVFLVVGGLVGGGVIISALKVVARGGVFGWIVALIFAGPFALIGTAVFFTGLGLVLFAESPWALSVTLIGVAVTVIAYLWISVQVVRNPKLKAYRKRYNKNTLSDDDIDEDEIDPVTIAGLTFGSSLWLQSTGSSIGSGGSSGYSSGSFSSGGGGFSGGGGDFGGGGASGDW